MNGTSTRRNGEPSEMGTVKAHREPGAEWIREPWPER